MRELAPLDLALVPIWGWGTSLGPGHMDPSEAAAALRLLRPTVAVPIHWGTFLPIGHHRRHGHLLRDPAERFRERAAAEAFATFRQDGFGYFLEMATRPQTIGYALLDSPVGLAAWLLDHDTDSYYKISRAFVDGEPVGNLTRDKVIDNITLYWLTGTAASAARSYWEDA